MESDGGNRKENVMNGRKVIMIMTDTQRIDMVGCYGYPDMKTPSLDQLAKEGVRFEKAYRPSRCASRPERQFSQEVILIPVLDGPTAWGCRTMYRTLGVA